MRFTDLQKYKHDTIGKFQIIKELIENITEEDLRSKDTIEILNAADEVYSKMALASKELLLKINKQN